MNRRSYPRQPPSHHRYPCCNQHSQRRKAQRSLKLLALSITIPMLVVLGLLVAIPLVGEAITLAMCLVGGCH